MRALILVLIATALVALGVVGSALLREDPTRKELQSTFFRHFEYAIPVDSDMRISGNASGEMVAWAGGPDTWEGATMDAADGSSQPHPHQVRGVVIGRGGEAVEPREWWQVHAQDGAGGVPDGPSRHRQRPDGTHRADDARWAASIDGDACRGPAAPTST